ncbi:MAG: hypothetical protein GWN62_34125 [Aliifodinibius sp.]|nr:hypothetical protein [Fodinibius sp.]
MNRKRIVFSTLLFLFFNCEHSTEVVETRDLESAVRENLIIHNGEEIPRQLVDIAEQKRILILGETHYIQEHQEFVSKLLQRLHAEGYRIFLIETFHAFSWMVADYVFGEIDYLPDHIRFFDNYWLEAIRNFNANLEDTEKIKFFYMDVNHWRDNFISSLLEIEKILGGQPLFDGIKSRQIDSPNYKSALLTLSNTISQNAAMYKTEWGNKWYERINEMIDVEIKSSNFRTSRDDNLREATMFDIIQSRIPENRNIKVAINCGSHHAQKNGLMGPKIKWITPYLNEIYPDDIYSIAFIGIKGERKSSFSDPNVIEFNLIRETSNNDLIRIIGVEAGPNMATLPLESSVFNKNVRVTYVSGSTFHLSPASQFDALITYPRVSILNSMSAHDYN